MVGTIIKNKSYKSGVYEGKKNTYVPGLHKNKKKSTHRSSLREIKRKMKSVDTCGYHKSKKKSMHTSGLHENKENVHPVFYEIKKNFTYIQFTRE